MKHSHLTILLLFLVTSCSTVKLSEREGSKYDKMLTNTNVRDINGIYSNKRIDTPSIQFFSLWKKLFFTKKDIDNWDSAAVKLKITEPGILTATLLINNSPVQVKKIRFKLTDGYLNLKRLIQVTFPIGPIFWGVTDIKIYLGLTKENRLVLIYSLSGTGFILFIPAGGSGGQNFTEYQRIN